MKKVDINKLKEKQKQMPRTKWTKEETVYMTELKAAGIGWKIIVGENIFEDFAPNQIKNKWDKVGI